MGAVCELRTAGVPVGVVAATLPAPAVAGFTCRRLPSTGGCLQQGNVTLMIGVDNDLVDNAIAIFRENCRERSQYMTPMPPMVEPGEFFMPYPVEVQVGGATVFVVDVERFEKL